MSQLDISARKLASRAEINLNVAGLQSAAVLAYGLVDATTNETGFYVKNNVIYNSLGVAVLTLNADGSLTFAVGTSSSPAEYTADGAITQKSGTVYISKSSAAAMTLAAPTSGAQSAGGDDGKRLTIISTTAFAHTVTQTTPGFNNGGTASDVGTFGAAIGNSIELSAKGGVWLTVSTPRGVTLA